MSYPKGTKRPDVSERNRKRAGANHPSFGKKNPGVSESNRKRIGENNPMWGKTLPPKVCEKIKERMTGENSPMKRPEVAGKQSNSLKARYDSVI